MNGSYLSLELNTIRIRTRRMTAVSVGIHVLLFLWLLLMPTIAQEEMTITEITLLEPVVSAPSSLPAAVTKVVPAREIRLPRQQPSTHDTHEQFTREQPEAAVAFEPQKRETASDKLNERLAVLQQQNASEPVQISAPISPGPVGRSVPAGVSVETGQPRELTRRETPGSAPIELNRAPRNMQKAATITTDLPEREVAPATSKKTDTQAQRMLAGASLTGPVADRPLLAFYKPEYPEWAKQEAIEGSVSIYFVVLPDGRIKENVMVQKTSGFGDFDDNAMRALLNWRFEPIEKGTTGEQWGTITFHYRLSGS